MIYLDAQKEELVAKERTYIYANDIRPYLDLIEKRMGEHAEAMRQFAGNLEPPYPFLGFTRSTHHFPDSHFLVESTLRHLLDNLSHISQREIEICVEEYQNLPERNSGKKGDNRDAMAISLSEEMQRMAIQIGEYWDNHDYHVPYLKHEGKVSFRLVVNTALIWLGRKLQREEAQKESQ